MCLLNVNDKVSFFSLKMPASLNHLFFNVIKVLAWPAVYYGDQSC